MPISSSYLTAKLAELRCKHAHAGNFCFFTDVENLPAIFAAGRLLCRSEVLRRAALRLDCASHQVLTHTPTWVHEYVRLYFAPATPMLYRIEGLKRQADGWPECPRPVYLVFDPQLLTMPAVRVSDGNMASNYSNWAEASDQAFEALPFDDIFHRGAVQKNQQATAVYGFDPQAKDRFRRRHAEALIPQELSLSFLRRMVFRSEAERDLALADIGGTPQGIRTEVDKNWFFANTRARPYLNTFTLGPGGTLTFANVIEGDIVTQIANRTGQLSAYTMNFQNSTWSTWKHVDPNSLGLPSPKSGRVVFHLNGRRVAERDA